MAGPGAFALGWELVTHHTMEGRIGHCQAQLLAQPLLQLPIAGKPTRGRQAGLELLEHGRREGRLPGRGSRLFVGQYSFQPAVAITAEPGGPGITVQSQMRRGLAPGGHVSRFEQDEEVQTGFAFGGALAMQPCLQGIEVFENGR
jgi:hypothetical protein